MKSTLLVISTTIVSFHLFLRLFFLKLSSKDDVMSVNILEMCCNKNSMKQLYVYYAQNIVWQIVTVNIVFLGFRFQHIKFLLHYNFGSNFNLMSSQLALAQTN